MPCQSLIDQEGTVEAADEVPSGMGVPVLPVVSWDWGGRGGTAAGSHTLDRADLREPVPSKYPAFRCYVAACWRGGIPT